MQSVATRTCGSWWTSDICRPVDCLVPPVRFCRIFVFCVRACSAARLVRSSPAVDSLRIETIPGRKWLWVRGGWELLFSFSSSYFLFLIPTHYPALWYYFPLITLNEEVAILLIFFERVKVSISHFIMRFWWWWLFEEKKKRLMIDLTLCNGIWFISGLCLSIRTTSLDERSRHATTKKCRKMKKGERWRHFTVVVVVVALIIRSSKVNQCKRKARSPCFQLHQFILYSLQCG